MYHISIKHVPEVNWEIAESPSPLEKFMNGNISETATGGVL